MNGNGLIAEESEKLGGVVEKISYQNTLSWFTVAQIQTEDRRVVAAGIMPGIGPGDSVEFEGCYRNHPKYGKEFRVKSCVKTEPKTADAIERYLAGGVIKGVGPLTARKIVRQFGSDSLFVIKNEPERLCELPGITPEKAAVCQRELSEKNSVNGVVLYFTSLGIEPSTGLKIYSELGDGAQEIVKQHPYLLCSEEIGVSFEKADEIAGKLSRDVSKIERAKSGIEYILRHNLANGHTCLPKEKLYGVARNLLNSDQSTVEDSVRELVEEKKLAETRSAGGESLALNEYYGCERMIAERLTLFMRTPPEHVESTEAEIAAIEEASRINYSDLQKLAVRLAVENGVFILTGGPGTGKTTTVNAIIRVLENRGLTVQLAAPTGRAAKRMQELCGRNAQTVHRLLEVSPNGKNGEPYYGRDENRPLDCDVLIVDEMSMVDVKLFNAVLKAMRLYTKLILVGDTDQLPGVSAGNVLADLIACGKFPSVRLNGIFRQAQSSLIVTNAHRVIEGKMPILEGRNADFFFIPARPREIAALVTDLYCKRLPRAYGYDPKNDIQILCPSRITDCGTVALNNRIQSEVNGNGSSGSVKLGGYVLRPGDKVIMSKNDYGVSWESDDGEKGSGVYNGEFGVLTAIDNIRGTATVRFPDKTAVYESDQIAQLDQAYAVTVHKSQGCEFPAVIIPLCNTPEKLRYRSLLYTAITRAKERAVIVGSAAVMRQMVENGGKNARYTSLRYLLNT